MWAVLATSQPDAATFAGTTTAPVCPWALPRTCLWLPTDRRLRKDTMWSGLYVPHPSLQPHLPHPCMAVSVGLAESGLHAGEQDVIGFLGRTRWQHSSRARSAGCLWMPHLSMFTWRRMTKALSSRSAEHCRFSVVVAGVVILKRSGTARNDTAGLQAVCPGCRTVEARVFRVCAYKG